MFLMQVCLSGESQSFETARLHPELRLVMPRLHMKQAVQACAHESATYNLAYLGRDPTGQAKYQK